MAGTTADPADPLAGGHLDPQRFKPYEIVRRVGRGAFAEVFQARNVSVHQDLAIKVLHPHLARDARSRKTFLEEAQLLWKISQHRVISARHVDGDGDVPWFVMDFAEHGNLDEWVRHLKTEGRADLSLEQLVGLGVELCDCLAALHHYEVVHYDLKPHNVLIGGLDEFGDQQRGRKYRLPPNQHLILGDLGLARTNGVVSDGVMGTPNYIAPEVVAGRGSARSDLFALGLMLYEFAHPGTRDRRAVQPYPGRIPSSDPRRLTPLFETEKWGAYQPLRDVRPELPAGFDHVVEKALAPEPSDRFTSADDLRQALESLLRRSTSPGHDEEVVFRGVKDVLTTARDSMRDRPGLEASVRELDTATERLRRNPQIAVLRPVVTEGAHFTLFLAGEPVAAGAPAPYGAVITYLREGDPEMATIEYQLGKRHRTRLGRDRHRVLRAELEHHGVRQLTLELDHRALDDLELVDIPMGATVDHDQVKHALSVADLLIVLVADLEEARTVLPTLREAARRSLAGPCGLIAVVTGSAEFGKSRTGAGAMIESIGYHQALGLANAGLTLRVLFQQMFDGARSRYIAASAALGLCEMACLRTNDWAIATSFVDGRDRLESEHPELRDLRCLREDLRGDFDMTAEFAREMRRTLSQPTPAGKLQLRSDQADDDVVRRAVGSQMSRWMAALADGSLAAGSYDAARVVVAALNRLQTAEDT